MSTPTGESWMATIGGDPAPVKGLTYDETVSVRKLDDRTLELTYSRDGKVVSVDKMNVARDGKKMTTTSDNKLTGRVITYSNEKE